MLYWMVFHLGWSDLLSRFQIHDIVNLISQQLSK
jgi:hypothetical protein